MLFAYALLTEIAWAFYFFFFLMFTRYKKMEACITPYPNDNKDEVSGGELQPFPDRLYAPPPKIANGSLPGVSHYYKIINRSHFLCFVKV